MILMEFDKAGAEWVIVAYLSGDANMLRVVNEGKSPHVITGSLISGAPESVVLLEHKIVGDMTDPDEILRLRAPLMAQLKKKYGKKLEDWYFPRTMSIRQAGKKSNHGLNYDMRYRRYALENEIEESEAKIQVDKYHTVAYPGIKGTFHLKVETDLRKDRTLINCFGRKRRFLQQWGPELLDAAYAFLPQSTNVDALNNGICDAYEDNSKVMAAMQLLTQTHDSVTTQYPTDSWTRCADFAMKMAEYISPPITYNYHSFTLATDLKVGLNWGEKIELKVPSTSREMKRLLLEAWDKLNEPKSKKT